MSYNYGTISACFSQLISVMFKYMKKYLIVIVLILMIAPHIVFAAWWNPLSWRIWDLLKSNPSVVSKEKVATSTQENIVALESEKTAKISQETAVEADALKKEIELLKKNQDKNTPALSQKTEIVKIAEQVVPKVTTMSTVLPDGAIAELDSNGNFIRFIKEAPAKYTVSSTGVVSDSKGNIITSTPTLATTPTSTLAPVPLSKPTYSNESQSFSFSQNMSGITYTVKYRIRSTSDNSPTIVKVISRFYLLYENQDDVKRVVASIEANQLSNLTTRNDMTYISYLGAQEAPFIDDGLNLTRYVVMFEKVNYQVSIQPKNVSNELTFRIALPRDAIASRLYVESSRIETVDGNIYEVLM